MNLNDLKNFFCLYENSIVPNVGIGTTSPASRLQIASSGPASSPLRLTASTGSSRILATESGANRMYLQLDDSTGVTNTLIHSQGDSYFNGGSLGVGTTTPNRLLEVAGAIRISPTVLPGTPGAGDIAIDSANSNTLKYHNGSSWVSVAGAAAVSGMTGYISQFTSNSTVGNSPMFVSGGNIGIGTTTPLATEKLAVILGTSQGVRVGSVGNDGTVALFVTPAASNQGALLVRGLVGQATDIFAVQDSSGTSYLKVSSTGNVGIGTTAPNRQLEVAGPIRVSPTALPGTPGAGDIAIDSANSNTLKYHNGSSWVSVAGAAAVSGTTGYMSQFTSNSTVGNSPVFVSGGNIGIGTTSPVNPLSIAGKMDAVSFGMNASGAAPANGMFAPNGNTTAFATASAERVRIDAAGNVGIGTTSPGAILHVAGSGPNMRSSTTGTSWNYLEFLNSGVRRGWVGADASNNMSVYAETGMPLILAADGAEKMRISSSGNVGIGTTSPGSALDIQSANDTMIKLGSTNATSPRQWGMQAVGSIDGRFRISDITAGQDRLTIIAGGNVGIGTTTPTRLLDVAGAIHLSPTVTPGSPLAGDLFFDSAASNSLKYHNGSSWVSIGSGTGDFMKDGSVAMTGALRHIAGTASAPGMTFASDTANGIFAPLANNIGLSTSGTERMRILANGNVGIGTSSPNRLLEIAGPIRVSPTTLPGTPAAGDIAFDSANANTLKYHNGSAWVSVAGASAVSGTNNYLTKFTSASTVGNSVMYETGGYIGIGTTTPSSKFSVSDSSTSTSGATTVYVDSHVNPSGANAAATYGLVAEMKYDGTATSTAGPRGIVGRAYNTSTGSIAEAYGVSGQVHGTASGGTITNAYGLHAQVNNAAGATMSNSYELSLSTANSGVITNQFGIFQSTPASKNFFAGNIGIGTTSPTRLLDVAGAVHLAPTATPSLPAAGDIFLDSAASNTLKYHNGSAWVSVAGAAAVSGTNNYLTKFTSASTVGNSVMFESGGNVGIGTTAPGATLDVVGSMGASGAIIAQGTITGLRYETFTNASAPNNGMFRPVSNTLAFSTNATERFRVDSLGNLGIGTTGPARNLHISGTGTPGLRIDNGTATTYTDFLEAGATVKMQKTIASGGVTIDFNPLAADGSGNAQVRMFRDTNTSGAKGLILYRGDSSALIDTQIGVAGTATYFNNSSVGIGTTSPNRLLEVAGPMRISPTALPVTPAAGDIAVDSGAANTLKFHNGSSWVSLASSASVSGTTGYLSQFTSTSAIGNSPFFASAGNISLGTTVPVAKMHIQGSTGAYNQGLAVQGDSVTNPSFIWNSTAGNMNFAGNGQSSPVMTVTNSSVGIGTTSPNRTLEVAGAMRLTPTALPVTPGAGDIAVDSANANTLKYHNGSAWVSVAGAAAVSGTNNYLTKFTSASTVGNSVMFESGGNVGIGTTAPVGKLDIRGQFAVTHNAATTYISPGSGTGPAWTMAYGNYNAFDNTSALNQITVQNSSNLVQNGYYGFVSQTGGANYSPAFIVGRQTGASSYGESMRIDSNGNVGIGTTSPAEKLDVNGNINLPYGNSLKSGSGSSFHNQTALATGWDGSGDVLNLTPPGDSLSRINFFTATTGSLVATQKMTILNNGNVGIGTTTPTRLLDVAGAIHLTPITTPSSPSAGDLFVDNAASNSLKYHNGSSWVSIGSGTGDFMKDGSVAMTGALRHLAGTASAPGMTFTGDTANGIFAPAANNLGIVTSGTERMRVLANGNIGIGTTSPLTNLDVSGSIAVSGGNWLSLDGGGTLTGTALRRNPGLPGLEFRSGGNLGMVLRDSGNLGVGTTSPNRLLEVAGPMRVQPTALPGTPGAGDLAVDSGAANTLKYYNGSAWVSVGAGNATAAGSANYLSKFTGASTLANSAMYESGGNVGIGTTSPGQLLHLYSASGTASQYIQTGAASSAAQTSYSTPLKTFSVGLNDLTNKFVIYDNTASAARFAIDYSTGHVGIGTTSPLRPLHVASSGAATLVLDYTSGGADQKKRFINNGAGGSLNFGKFSDDMAVTSYHMMIDNSGNVGIGTTTPNRLLEVAGPMRVQPSTTPSSPAAGDLFFDSAASNSLKYHNGSSWVSIGSGTGDFMKDGSVAMTGAFRSVAGSASAPGVSFSGDTDNGIFLPAADTIAFGTSGIERMRILPNGNIGIGISTSPVPLYVNGAMVTTGTATLNNTSTPSVTGGATISSNLKLISTSNVGTTDYISLSTGNSVERMRVLSNGNVGIGTSTAQRLLEVAGPMRMQPTTLPGSPGAGDIAVDSGAANTLKYYNGSTWVSVGSGSLTGTGTTNYSARFTGASTLGNGTLWDNGLSVGIGTTSPQGALHIVSDAGTPLFASAYGNSSALTLQRGAGTSASPSQLTTTGAVGFIVGQGLDETLTMRSVANISLVNAGPVSSSSSPGRILLATAPTGTVAPIERVRIDTDGSVGIGTTSPSRLLHVAGAMKLTPVITPGSPTAGDIFVDSAATNTLKYYNGSSWQTVGSGGGDFLRNGSLAMTGNFNAGGYRIQGSSAPSGNLILDSTSNATRGLIILSPEALMYQQGWVGIGTSAPADALHIVQNHGGTGVALRVQNTGAGAGATSVIHLDSANGDTYVDYGGSGYATSWSMGAKLSDLSMRWNATTGAPGLGNADDKMILTSTGRLGIGTTAPSRLLQVAGAMKLTPVTTPGSPTAGDIFVDSAATNTLKYYNGSSWQTVGGGGLTGSGTANYSARFTGASALGTGAIWDNGSSVGIGTTAPSFALEVAAPDSVGSSFALRNTTYAHGLSLESNYPGVGFNSFYSSSSWRGFSASNYTGVAELDPTSGTFTYSSGTAPVSNNGTVTMTPRLTITNSGNVGVGVSAASRLFQVNGPMKITPTAAPSSPTAGDLFVDLSAANTLKYYNGSAWVASGSGSSQWITTGSDIYYTAGRIGIGLSVPAAKVDVRGDGVSANFRVTDSSAVARVAIGNSYNLFLSTPGGQVNSVVASDSANNSYFGAQGGNLGVGTSSPASKLAISGGGQTTANMTTASSLGATLLLDDTGTSPGNGGSVLFSAANQSWKFAAIKGLVTNGGGNSQGDIAFSTRKGASDSTLTEAMRITSGGYVGVGTTAPTDVLHVQQAIDNTPATLKIRNEGSFANAWSVLRLDSKSSDSIIVFTGDAMGYNWTSGVDVTDNRFKWNVTTGSPGVGNVDDIMVLTPTGRLGIGNTNPGAKLHIQGDGTNPAMRVTDTSSYNRLGFGANYNFFLTNESNVTHTVLSSISSSNSYLNATGGNVGIGKTNPSYKLDVVGDIAASGCLRSSAGIASGTCSSDERLKTDIQPFSLGLEALLGINPHFLKYNGLGGHPVSDKPELGVIAQEVEKTAPQLIVTKDVKLNPEDAQTTEIKQVNYTAFTYVLINSVKDLYHRWFDDSQALHREIASVKAENAQLKANDQAKDQKLQTLERQNAEIKAYLCAKDPQATICK